MEGQRVRSEGRKSGYITPAAEVFLDMAASELEQKDPNMD